MALEPNKDGIEEMLADMLKKGSLSGSEQATLLLAGAMMNLKTLDELQALRADFAKVNKRLDELEARLDAQNDNTVRKVKIGDNGPKA